MSEIVIFPLSAFSTTAVFTEIIYCGGAYF